MRNVPVGIDQETAALEPTDIAFVVAGLVGAVAAVALADFGM